MATARVNRPITRAENAIIFRALEDLAHLLRESERQEGADSATAAIYRDQARTCEKLMRRFAEPEH